MAPRWQGSIAALFFRCKRSDFLATSKRFAIAAYTIQRHNNPVFDLQTVLEIGLVDKHLSPAKMAAPIWGTLLMARKNPSKTNGVKEEKLVYAACRVEPGMFRDELLVYLDARDPENPNQDEKVQVLVDQREVKAIQGTPKRNNPASGWLKVSLVGKKGDWLEIVLPQPSQPLGEAILVSPGSVREAPPS